MASRLGQYLDRLKEHPLSRVGPGLITGVADDDPSGIATVLPGWRPVRPQHALDDAAGLPFDGRDPIHVRAHWPGHGKGASRQHQGRISSYRASWRRAASAGRQHPQHRRRCRGHGRGRGARDRFQSSSHDGVLRVRHATAANIHSLPPLRRLPEMADRLAAGLCRGLVHGSRPVEPGSAAHVLAEVHAERRRCCCGRRRLWHDDQPVSLLLAGLPGGRGHAGGNRSRAAGE